MCVCVCVCVKRVLGKLDEMPSQGLSHTFQKRPLASVSSKQPWCLRVRYDARTEPHTQQGGAHEQGLRWATSRVHTNYENVIPKVYYKLCYFIYSFIIRK